MAAYPSPLTAENFKAAWKYIARKQRWSMKKSLIRRLAVMLAQIVYGCVFVIMFALGELSGSEQGPMHAVLYGAGVVLCYHAVNLPLRLLLKALHLCYIPKTMTADAERCYAQLKSPAPENRIDPEK